MKSLIPICVLLSAASLLVGGCAGSSQSPPNATTSTPTAGKTFATDSRGGRTESSPPERWNYDTLPTPAPSKTPGYRLNEIGFADDSTALDREGIAICHLMATRIKSMDTGRFLIIGFSHKTEQSADLGLRRAEAVLDCLAADGLEKSRFETASFGSQFSQVANSPHPYLLTAAQGVEIWTLDE